MLVALSLSHPRGFITGPTAGAYLGLRRMPRASKIHLCLPHPIRIDEPDGVLLRQSTRVASFDVRVLPNGIRVANWPRLAFDLAADLSQTDLESVIDQMLKADYCTLEELGATARRLCHPTRRGSTLFLRTLHGRGDRRPIDSHPELVIMNGLLARGIPVQPQSDLRLPNGRRIRIDLAVPAVRWAIEVDIHPEHDRPSGVASDKRRDRQSHLIDWQVERVTEDDYVDLAALLDELTILYRTRVLAVAAA